MTSALLQRILASTLLSSVAAGQWLDVPFVQQSASACGPASAAMVMQYWAREMPELRGLSAEGDRVARTPVSSKGMSGSELRRLLEANGFTAFVLKAELSDLQAHIQRGRPLIVCFAPAGKTRLMHYAVVSGLEEDAVLLNDPTRGKLFRESLSRFLSQWNAAGNWALLAVPRTGR